MRVQETIRLRANTGQPVGSMGGFEGGNELLAVLGLGQWARHFGVAEGRVEKLKENSVEMDQASWVCGLPIESPVSAPIQALQQKVQDERNSGTGNPPMGFLHHLTQYRRPSMVSLALELNPWSLS